MPNTTQNDSIRNSIQRFLNITCVNDCIDLSNSYSIYNQKSSRILFESEIYKVTFKTLKKSYHLFLSANELICNSCINYLKNHLGIEVLGDGSFFEILNYTCDFKIIFDTENTTFINTNTVTNGVINFHKRNTTISA